MNHEIKNMNYQFVYTSVLWEGSSAKKIKYSEIFQNEIF